MRLYCVHTKWIILYALSNKLCKIISHSWLRYSQCITRQLGQLRGLGQLLLSTTLYFIWLLFTILILDLSSWWIRIENLRTAQQLFDTLIVWSSVCTFLSFVVVSFHYNQNLIILCLKEIFLKTKHRSPLRWASSVAKNNTDQYFCQPFTVRSWSRHRPQKDLRVSLNPAAYTHRYTYLRQRLCRNEFQNSSKMIVSCKCLNIQIETKYEPIKFDKHLLGGGFFSKVKIDFYHFELYTPIVAATFIFFF